MKDKKLCERHIEAVSWGVEINEMVQLVGRSKEVWWWLDGVGPSQTRVVSREQWQRCKPTSTVSTSTPKSTQLRSNCRQELSSFCWLVEDAELKSHFCIVFIFNYK